MAELVASAGVAQDIGDRVRQEDAALIHNAHGADPTLAVLSDGMGGLDDGDLASRIITREMFGELFIAAARPEAFMRQSRQVFRAALGCANSRLRQHISAGHISDSTGGTLVSVAIMENRVHWVSVGDSLLYHLRQDGMVRLNENHSMSAQLELLVANDLMDHETASNHPDRHCLTSAVTGGAIQKVDCPDEGEDLEDGDILLVASDGIGVLTQEEVRAIIQKNRKQQSSVIANALLRAVKRQKAPGQDNTSIIVIKIQDGRRADYSPHPLAGFNVSSLFSWPQLRMRAPRNLL